MAVPADRTDPELAGLRDTWVRNLADEEKAHKSWRDVATRANDNYFACSTTVDGKNDDEVVAYPLFWSIINVLLGRIFATPPSPDVRKRFPDEQGKQPIGPGAGMGAGPPGAVPQAGGMQPAPPMPPQPGQPPAAMGGAPGQAPPAPVQPTVDDNKIAQCIERALQYVIDVTAFDADSRAAVRDFLITSLGVAKIEIDVQTQSVEVINPETGAPVPKLDPETNEPILDKAGNPEPMTQEIVVDKSVRLRHFGFNQFQWEPQQHWANVSWVAFKHGMTKDEIFDTWGVTINASASKVIKAGGTPAKNKPQADKYDRLFDVYEIWDKKTRQVIFVCEQAQDALEVRDDPLNLKDFFPCPEPMMDHIRPDDLVPQPDFIKCEQMFKTADTLSGRIDSLTRQVKDVGFYDAALGDLATFKTADDGSLIPLANLAQRFRDVNPGGALTYESVVLKQDNTIAVQTIQTLAQMLGQTKEDIREIYGVSDIQRGTTDPNETATAQNIKAQWADIRVGQRIRVVALFFRDVFRIMADVITTFPPDVIFKMTGIQLNEPEMAIFSSDVGRDYAIDVESDSTVAQDEYADQYQRIQLLNSTTKYLQVIGPAMMQNQIPADLGKALLLVGINGFKYGRQVEESIDNLPSSMQQLAKMQQQLQQAGEQLKGLQQQNQGLQKQLQAVNAGKEQRENIKTSVDAGKTQADTEHTEMESAKLAQEIHQSAQPHLAIVATPRPA